MLSTRILGLAGALVCAVAVVAAAQEAGEDDAATKLGIGDAAPPITVAKWVKGDPVKEFEPGKVYVVEFWATWCGPCRTSIPHLSELQDEYEDVKFVGVSIAESDWADVEPFVEEMGDKMDYTVATDDVSDGDGQMSKNWMEASGSNGIPTAFIVKEGKVAWIGHPMTMDKPLKDITSGDFDFEKAVAAARAEKAREKTLMGLQQKVVAALQKGDFDKALEVLDGAIAEDEGILTPGVALTRFQLLLKADRQDEAASYLGTLVDEKFQDDAQTLNGVAWMLVDPARPEEASDALQKVALTAARRACELTDEKDFAILDTLARAYFLNDDPAKALATQQKAVDQSGDAPDETKAELKDRLEQYRKAAEKSGSK